MRPILLIMWTAFQSFYCDRIIIIIIIIIINTFLHGAFAKLDAP